MTWKNESSRHSLASKGISTKQISLKSYGIERACCYCGHEWVKQGDVCSNCGFVDSEYCKHDEGYAKELCVKCGTNAEDIMRPPKVKMEDEIEYFEWRLNKMVPAIADSSVYWDEGTNSFEVWIKYPDVDDTHYAYWDENNERWESGEF